MHLPHMLHTHSVSVALQQANMNMHRLFLNDIVTKNCSSSLIMAHHAPGHSPPAVVFMARGLCSSLNWCGQEPECVRV